MTLFSPNTSITTSNLNGLIYQLKDILSDGRGKKQDPSICYPQKNYLKYNNIGRLK